MKKLLAVILIVVTSVFLLAGCMSKFKCNGCGEEKFGVPHKGEILGMEYTFCDDCHEIIEELKNSSGN